MRYRLSTLLIFVAMVPPALWLIYHTICFVWFVIGDGGIPDRSAGFRQ
jgi:hypothetical protein